jgi:hypothetical protein
MLQYDLSNTPLARATERINAPSEGEMLAVMLGLMFAYNCSFSELKHRMLQLSPENRHEVADLIESRLTPLLRDIGSGRQLRQRLDQLLGFRVTRTPTGVFP